MESHRRGCGVAVDFAPESPLGSAGTPLQWTHAAGVVDQFAAVAAVVGDGAGGDRRVAGRHYGTPGWLCAFGRIAPSALHGNRVLEGSMCQTAHLHVCSEGNVLYMRKERKRKNVGGVNTPYIYSEKVAHRYICCECVFRRKEMMVIVQLKFRSGCLVPCKGSKRRQWHCLTVDMQVCTS